MGRVLREAGTRVPDVLTPGRHPPQHVGRVPRAWPLGLRAMRENPWPHAPPLSLPLPPPSTGRSGQAGCGFLICKDPWVTWGRGGRHVPRTGLRPRPLVAACVCPAPHSSPVALWSHVLPALGPLMLLCCVLLAAPLGGEEGARAQPTPPSTLSRACVRGGRGPAGVGPAGRFGCRTLGPPVRRYPSLPHVVTGESNPWGPCALGACLRLLMLGPEVLDRPARRSPGVQGRKMKRG